MLSVCIGIYNYDVNQLVKDLCKQADKLGIEYEILLLDEPVASVDSSVEKDIYEMLLDMNKKITIVMVSHDIGFVSSFVNKIGCVNKIFVEHNSKDEMCCLEEHHAYSGKTTMIHHKCGI